jgi:hypothetical protein
LPAMLVSADAISRFVDDAEDPANCAMFVANGRIGDVEIDRFRAAVPLDVEGAILCSHRFSGLQHPAQKWLKIIPKFGPVLSCGPDKRLGVPLANRRSIGFVIERDQVGSPEHHDLGHRWQHDVDGGFEADRPF